MSTARGKGKRTAGKTPGAKAGDRGLADLARMAGRKAYAPYSRFRVGAALLGQDGRVFTGCNVENASYGLSICAERNAVARAVAEGCVKYRAIAIASDRPGLTSPCGACRQVLAEFNPRLRVIMSGSSGRIVAARLDRLLPASFGPDDLKGKR